MAKVFLTGCDGYIGTLLAGVLMERGHEVTGCDTGFHRIGWLYNGVGALPRVLVRDIRRLEAADLAGHDAVLHLAELSNDPVGELAPHITYAINHQGSVRLARLAREAGITRFIYFSSCSVYGASADKAQDEQGDTQPLTAYAECKLLVERDVGAMAADDFSPTFLRNATAYGASPRQRFDLVVNNLSGLAWCQREIRMDSDGTPGARWCTCSTSARRPPAPSRRRARPSMPRRSTSAPTARTTRCGTSPPSWARPFPGAPSLSASGAATSATTR